MRMTKILINLKRCSTTILTEEAIANAEKIGLKQI